MVYQIESPEHLKDIQARHPDFLVLAFYAEFSDAARRALSEIEKFSRENDQIPVCIVDVQEVKEVHKAFNVRNVPTVLAVRRGKAETVIEGLQSARFYARAFAGGAAAPSSSSAKRKQRTVVVYTGSHCPWCSRVKQYLRQHGVGFREVDVSRNEHEAEKMVRRTGNMSVPQVVIDGHVILGFDQAKLDSLLGIQSQRSQ